MTENNPYENALLVLGFLVLALGVILILAAEAARWLAVGSVMANLGALMFVGWLVVSAIRQRESV